VDPSYEFVNSGQGKLESLANSGTGVVIIADENVLRFRKNTK
jgi:hypothetical protein